METKKRNPILAPLLSIVAPGLGQMYNGQLVKGIIFYLIGYLLFFLVFLTGLQFKFYGLIFIFALLICFLLFILGDALIFALKKREIVLKAYNRWYLYVLFAILAFGFSEVSDFFIKVNPLRGIKPYSIPSGAMIPTLMIGDRIIVNLEYYKTNALRRGDIVVFTYPEDPERDFIRRVIAIEGDVIEGKDKMIYLNGKELKEPYISHTDIKIMIDRDGLRDNFGPVNIPKNKIFIMGDNRDNSYDSRYRSFVDVKDIKGKALSIYWSENKSRISQEIK